MPLMERFEAASGEFARNYFYKARLARAGICPYSGAEFYEDLYRAAGNHGLFYESLWAYFALLHGTD